MGGQLTLMQFAIDLINSTSNGVEAPDGRMTKDVEATPFEWWSSLIQDCGVSLVKIERIDRTKILLIRFVILSSRQRVRVAIKKVCPEKEAPK